MINKLSKNWFLVLSIGSILLAFICSYISPELWLNNNFGSYFLKRGFFLCPFFTFLWLVQHHKILFKKNNYLRSLIIFIGAASVFLWTYKHKITFRLDLLLLLLCGIYGIIERKWIRPDKVTITFFLLIILRFLGILWSENKLLAWEGINADMLYFLLLAPIIGLWFRVKEDEMMSFIALCFKLFLLLLTLNFCGYIFTTRAIEIPFFSFLTLNKGYMNFYGYILEWTFFKHPSFISWIILLIWGLGILVWKKNNKLISLPEIILYGILLISFSFIMQARVVIVGIPLTILLLGWFNITKNWPIYKRFLAETGMLIIIAVGIYLLVTHTTYFSDPIRENILKKAFESIGNSPIIGNGSIFEKIISNQIGAEHIHNDFLATFIDLGIVGLLLLFLWILFTYQRATIVKDNITILCMANFLLLMNTDIILNSAVGIYILLPFLIFIFFKEDSAIANN